MLGDIFDHWRGDNRNLRPRGAEGGRLPGLGAQAEKCSCRRLATQITNGPVGRCLGRLVVSPSHIFVDNFDPLACLVRWK
jgi:hypothetical protein